MASINKLVSGKWCVQIRCKGHYASAASRFATTPKSGRAELSGEIDLAQKSAPKHKDGIRTVSDLIDLHIADMVEVGK